MATNAQLDTRLKAVEAWRKTVVPLLADLTARLIALETATTADYSATILAMQADIAALKALTCPEAERLQAMETALATLVADHVPEA